MASVVSDNRRRVLQGGLAIAGLSLLSACGTRAPVPPSSTGPAPPPPLVLPPLRTGVDRITRISVCTRPFRAEGPRIEAERIGGKTVVHNYGHGGSGWSLSWGSATLAADLVRETEAKAVGVIGCGAIGLATALTLQRRGLAVTIYARDLPPDTLSTLATGVWSPDSRIALEDRATPAFRQRWERMCRLSFDGYQSLLGLPGDPVEWYDNYAVVDLPLRDPAPHSGDRPKFVALASALDPRTSHRLEVLTPGLHPFGDRRVRHTSFMMFNISALSRQLMGDFLVAGGRIEVREFRSPAEFARLPQRTLVNCAGYGAKALFGDLSLIPVRGQLARTPPQPDIRYGLYYDSVSFVPRRDGFVFQYLGEDDYFGYGDDSRVPDRAEAERAVSTIARLFAA